ncbi:MAG: OB-fold nucleic acid binding domain-containing protein, partial [Cellulomonadaceae bacterium]
PLSGLEHVLSRAAETSIASLLNDEARPDGSTVTIAGLITSLQRKMSKNGNPWAAVTIEDLEGGVEVMFFGETYLAYSTVLAEDTVVVLRGRVRRRDETMQLQAMEMSLPDVSLGHDSPVQVSMPMARCTQPVVERLREILSTHPGSTEVQLRLVSPGRATVMRLEDRLRVERSPALFGDLKALLGPSCLTH